MPRGVPRSARQVLVILEHEFRLGITGRVGIDLFVRRVDRLTVSETHFRLNYSGYLFEEMLRSPETSSG